MSNLDSFHPFRQSVNNREQGSPVTSVQQESSNAPDDNEKESKSWLSWKTKFRILIFLLTAILLLFVVNTAISSFSSNSNSVKDNILQEPSKSSEIFDKNDLNERGREVSSARKKAGFFASIFCRGAKRASFCDN